MNGVHSIQIINILREWKMTTNKELLEEIKKLNEQMQSLQLTVDQLSVKLNKHIGFIDETYESLKNPINAAKRFLGR